MDNGNGGLTYMHRVVVACAAKGGEASEEGERAGVRFDCETEVLAGDLGDNGEAAVWVVSFGCRGEERGWRYE